MLVVPAFQSTHPLRGATSRRSRTRCRRRNFNPRTPCGVRLTCSSMRPATSWISIHAPLAGCDLQRGAPAIRRTISIHAPLAGCDAFRGKTDREVWQFQSTHPLRGATLTSSHRGYSELFQSTHPLRGATLRDFARDGHVGISIHAPLAGCDPPLETRRRRSEDFNPRTPCGVRPELPGQAQMVAGISIHAPLAGCDCDPQDAC